MKNFTTKKQLHCCLRLSNTAACAQFTELYKLFASVRLRRYKQTGQDIWLSCQGREFKHVEKNFTVEE